MDEQRVASFAELHEALGRLRRDAGWVWRGQADAVWRLLPRAGRAAVAGEVRPGQDEIFFRRWQGDARQYLEAEPEDEWEWLALAHLSGFSTRVMSWSTRPLAAAWFAVAEPREGDAVLYALKAGNLLPDSERAASPWQARQSLVQFTPRRVPPGHARQNCVLTLHTPATRALDGGRDGSDRLERIVIAAGYRRGLLFELNQYGVNRETLFPGLAGLSGHFNWVQSSFSYWAEGLRSAGD